MILAGTDQPSKCRANAAPAPVNASFKPFSRGVPRSARPDNGRHRLRGALRHRLGDFVMTYVSLTIGIGGEKENVRRVVGTLSDAMHEAVLRGEVTDVQFYGQPYDVVPVWMYPARKARAAND